MENVIRSVDFTNQEQINSLVRDIREFKPRDTIIIKTTTKLRNLANDLIKEDFKGIDFKDVSHLFESTFTPYSLLLMNEKMHPKFIVVIRDTWSMGRDTSMNCLNDYNDRLSRIRKGNLQVEEYEKINQPQNVINVRVEIQTQMDCLSPNVIYREVGLNFSELKDYSFISVDGFERFYKNKIDRKTLIDVCKWEGYEENLKAMRVDKVKLMSVLRSLDPEISTLLADITRLSDARVEMNN